LYFSEAVSTQILAIESREVVQITRDASKLTSPVDIHKSTQAISEAANLGVPIITFLTGVAAMEDSFQLWDDAVIAAIATVSGVVPHIAVSDSLDVVGIGFLHCVDFVLVPGNASRDGTLSFPVIHPVGGDVVS